MKVIEHQPQGWTTVPLWALYQRVKDVDHPDERLLSVSRDRGVVPKDSLLTGKIGVESNSIYQLVHPGWLVVNRMQAWRGAVGVSKLRGIVSGHYICFRPRSSAADPRYLHHLLRSAPYINAYASMSRGVRPGQAEIDNDLLHALQVLLPPLDDQLRIADFLDAQTARIDRLVSLREAQISLLAEAASVIVDQALVNEGLRWPARLVAGLSEWALPPGWALMSLSRVLDQLTNGYVGPTRDILEANGIRYIQSLHIKNGEIDFERRPFYVAEPWHRARPRINLRPDDVLIVQTGDIGQVAVVPPDFGEASCHALQIARVRKSVMTGQYLGLYLQSRFGYHSLLSRATGALHPHLEAGIKDVPVVVPPRDIQARLVGAVATVRERYRALDLALHAQVSLLQERRAALITAAVTGELDVPTSRGAA